MDGAGGMRTEIISTERLRRTDPVAWDDLHRLIERSLARRRIQGFRDSKSHP
jgi:hypothetical protein